MRRSKATIYQQVARREISVEEALRAIKELGDSAAPSRGPVPLSAGQKALWIAYQLDPGQYAYNVPLAYVAAPDLNGAALERAIRFLQRRHPVLSGRFVEDAEGAVAQVWDSAPSFSLERISLDDADEAAALPILREHARRPFDLTGGPLLRAAVFERPGAAPLLLINVHHIVFDGLSIQIFLAELQECYAAASAGDEPALAPLAADFADYVAWQRAMLDSPAGQRHRDYWLSQLAGKVMPLELPYDREPSGPPSFKGAICAIDLPAPLASAIQALALEHGLSNFSMVLASFTLLLSRYGRQRSIYVGTPMSGRPESRFDTLVGYFMNMAVIGSDLSDNPGYLELARRIYATTLDTFAHSTFPLFALAGELGGNLPFQAAFYFQNWVAPLARQTAAAGALLTRPLLDIHQEGEFTLTLEVIELDDRYTCYFKYNPDYFDRATIERMAGHFRGLLAAAVARPDQPTCDLSILSDDEYRQQIIDWNRTAFTYPHDLSLSDLIAQQAERTPAVIAAVEHGGAGRQMSYAELAAAVDRVAGHLQARGIGRGARVAVLIDRSIELLVGLLAIMRAGAAYVPLDPIYPRERLATMLEDSEAALLLTQERLRSAAPATTVATALIEDLLAPAAPDYAHVASDPESAAYVIYTSGSTGTPKGVEVTQRGLLNFLCSMRATLGFGAADRMLALTTICFDIAGLELYLPLIAGGSVEILPAEVARDGYLLKTAVETSAATFIQATPATWTMLLAAEWDRPAAGTILCGGERLSYGLAQQLLARAATVWNLYGPTETTIWSTASKVAPRAPITIGRPIGNTQVYILDEAMQPVPPGVAGELHIGGDGVARGYWRRPELTAARFVSHAFAGAPPARLYKTGDLAHYRPDGEIEHLGRIDEQVKIRGFRIELMEIESVLRQQPGVREAVVVQRADSTGQEQLVAFVAQPSGAAEQPGHHWAAALREGLRQSLPEYMVPAAFVALRTFPLTLNQKVERKVLKALPLAAITAQYGYPQASPAARQAPAAPDSSAAPAPRPAGLLAELADLASGIVGLAAADIDPALPFGAYGFDSVRFTQFSTALRKRFGVPVTPSVFYQKPTLRDLAEHMRTIAPAAGESEPPAPSPAAPESASAAAPARPAAAIAVIGMAGRMPQSRDLGEFWEHIIAGHDLITPIPGDRPGWRSQAAADLSQNEWRSAAWGGFIPDVDTFDAAFFGISPREAALMDPQQRLSLEMTWKAIEDAGYRPSALQDASVGVFIGTSGSDFLGMTEKSIDAYTLTGIARSVIANRISYLFNFHGPSEPVDTACSSSLVAVHRAVQAIRNGECDLALAGGVNVMLSDFASVAASKVGMLSPDGRCKTFDASANGYVRGEGVAMILLKPLDRALADGDHIYGVIRSSAVNHGGRANSLTAPNPNAQSALLYAAYSQAGIDPATIGYIETHGTGTALGDPIEVDGLKAAFQRLYADAGRQPAAPHCGIGSVKTNIGHLEAAAGIAGLIKTLLALKERYLPATIHLTELNPYIDLADSPIYIVDQGRSWPAASAGVPRRGGVSSFGFGGANAHVIVEEAPPGPALNAPGGPELIVVSARTPEALAAAARQLQQHVERIIAGALPAASLRDIATTLLVGREAFRERLALVVENLEMLAGLLASAAAGATPDGVFRGTVRGGNQRPDGPDATATQWAPGDLRAAAAAWVAGGELDWAALHLDTAPGKRTPLPTYPFAPDRYPARENPAGAAPAQPRLHPLVERNTSTFREPRFSTLLHPDAFYLRDHVVQGQPVLPGVTYLEIARAAGGLAAEQPVRRISNLIWTRPCIVTTPRELTVTLQPQGESASYAISTSGDGATIVHAQGTVHYGDPVDPDRYWGLDAAGLRARLPLRQTGVECYRLFADNQFTYGPSFQVIDHIAYSDDEALAALTLPESQRGSLADFGLHPSLLDGALQTVILLLSANPQGASGLALPFAIGELEILRPLTAECLVHATRNPTRAGDGALTKYTITVYAPSGEPLVRIADYAIRAVATAGGVPAAAPAPTSGSPAPPASPAPTVYYAPRWELADDYELHEGA